MDKGTTPLSNADKPIKPIHLCLPHYNGHHDVIRAYLSIMERTNYPFKLTIIDDNSSPEDEGYMFLSDMEAAGAFPENVRVIFNEENMGVTKNLNTCFRLFPDLDIVRLDADIEIQSNNWLNSIVDFAYSADNIGVVAPIGCDIDMVTIQTAGQWLVISPEDYEKTPKFEYEIFDMMGKNRFLLKEPKEVDSCLGCCVFFKREVIDKIGGVDEGYFGWVEDNDMCVSARYEGYKCFIIPSVSYCHHNHAPKRSNNERSKILAASDQHFFDKWGWSIYDPVRDWEEIKEKYKGTELLWRYPQS